MPRDARSPSGSIRRPNACVRCPRDRSIRVAWYACASAVAPRCRSRALGTRCPRPGPARTQRPMSGWIRSDCPGVRRRPFASVHVRATNRSATGTTCRSWPVSPKPYGRSRRS
jgi:hypothetical protein